MNTRTATPTGVKLTGFKGHAVHYRLSEPLDGNEYVVVSAVDLTLRFPDDSMPYLMQIETYIFGATEDGEVAEWRELPGSRKGTLEHEDALREAGYEVNA